MNDWQLFEAMNEAEKRFDELKAEFRKRDLHNKPFSEYSHIEPESLTDDCQPETERKSHVYVR